MMTPRQKQIFDYIQKCNRKNGYSPSLEEVAKHFRLNSVSTVHQHIKALENKGYLERQPNQRRSMEIAKTEKMVRIPLLGTIAAGEPIEAVEEKESIAVPANKVPTQGNIFALRVKGESMVDESINDGDVILVKQQSIAEDGQKVVALIDGDQATVKKFFKERGHIRLQPANKTVEPIIIKKDRNINIQGVVVGTINRSASTVLRLPISAKPASKVTEHPNLNKVVLDNATIFRADCLNAFKGLQENSIDLIATDPPYFLDGMDNEWSDSELKKKEARASTIRGLPVGMRFNPEQGKRLHAFFAQISQEALRTLKPGGFMIVFSQGRLFHRIAIAAEDAGFEIRDMLIWEHNGGQGKAFTQNHFVQKMNISKEEKEYIIKKLQSRKTPQLRPKFEAILLAQKPKRGTFVENWMKWKTGLIRTDFETQQTTILSYKKSHLRKEIDHMTIKPLDLMERLIEIFSIPKQIVLDPFMGSGTTGVAAIRKTRRFIGFEIEEKYFRIAERRLKNYEKTR